MILIIIIVCSVPVLPEYFLVETEDNTDLGELLTFKSNTSELNTYKFKFVRENLKHFLNIKMIIFKI